MNRLLLGVVLLVFLALGVWQWSTLEVSEPTPPEGTATSTPPENDNGGAEPASAYDMIVVDSPLPGATITSPLTVSGKARGGWYFEASFPVRLLDANGTVLAELPATAEGEWMTSEYVPFSATFSYQTPTTPTGTLVFHNDNPSGLPENDRQLDVPVVFGDAASASDVTSIKLYYYDPSRDQGPGGPACSAAGLVALERTIPKTTTPLRDSIALLLRGDVFPQETARGIDTEFPLAGVSLTSATLTNGVATLTFSDPQNQTGGGSCRVSILRAQIEATATQFPTVKEVRILPEEAFQP
jgi:hypothetical protein